jgi:hypothetical protein
MVVPWSRFDLGSVFAFGLGGACLAYCPNGGAVVWDFRGGPVPLHGCLSDPIERAHGSSSLRVVSATLWRWPWRLTLTRRIELTNGEAGTEPTGT